MHYRTEVLICVGCKIETKYRFRVDEKWAGCFRMAINARHCPRCSSISKLANEGDSFCKKWVKNHVVAYA